MPDYLLTFWFDHPPVSGWWRIYLYGGLFLQALLAAWHSPPFGDSPLQAPEVVRHSAPAFYEPAGLMRGLGRWASDSRLLSLVRGLVVAAWIACIIGLGGRWSAAVVALGVLYLHGAMSGALGVNHRWMVPMYVLAVAALVDLNRDHSVDSWLAAHAAAYPFAPGSGPQIPSGLLRQATILFASYTLFAAAYSKLTLAGPRWMDGETLRFFIGRPKVGASPALKQWLVARPWACRSLSTATIALQLASPLALCRPEYAAIILVSAAAFHFGIWLTLNPNYLPQTWCYALGLGFGAGGVATASPEAGLTAIGMTVLALALGVVAIARIEWWPFTCVPMYGFYRGPAQAWPHDRLLGPRQVRQLGAEFRHSGLPYPLGWMESWVALRIRTGVGQRTLQPADVVKKHWNRLLQRAAAGHFAQIDAPATASSALAFLERHRAQWVRYLVPEERAQAECWVEFVCRMDAGEAVLAALKLPPAARATGGDDAACPG